MANSTFRFLDLPKEVRLIIYGHIPITTRHHIWEDIAKHTFWGEFVSGNTITLVVKSISTEILRVSSLVHEECKPILNRKLQAIQAEPLRLIADRQSVHTLTHHLHDEGVHKNSLLYCLEDFTKFKAGQEHSQRWEDKQVQLSAVKFNPEGTTRIMEFLDLIRLYRENRSPLSSMIAIRLKGFYGEALTVVQDFVGPVREPMFGFPAPTWTYHPSMRGVEEHECSVKDEFAEMIRVCRDYPDLNFIRLAEPGPLEEWAGDWGEGEV
ncbi:hypothetical protein BKA58DRAFT_471082 [Alternaria rosae]|uniref:uncharacterized protein n=1 Tax=Alternaria rosae TaxID=1187941 RepID=UPI001E8E7921|nr:uncharacterized protein BKA58DRAFT_471082 [Alternaria rosae]KAH6866837.1 hypothetical protein BKA58DRAFT_471082 [Alternaria rosae]